MKFKLEWIEWSDSYGCGSAWEPIEDIRTHLHSCYSVGWVIKETEGAITIVPHYSPRSKEISNVESGCGDMTIPKTAIISRKELHVITRTDSSVR